MTVTAVSRCPKCAAVVNVYWASCLVCQTILRVPTAPAPSGLIQTIGEVREIPEPPFSAAGW